MKGEGMLGRDGKKKGGAKVHMVIDAKNDIPVFVTLTGSREHDLVLVQKLQVLDFSTVVMDKAYVNYYAFKRWDGKRIKWITRPKRDTYISEKVDLPISQQNIDAGIQRDKLVQLGRPSNEKKTPLIDARVVDYYDIEKKCSFTFITNDLVRSPLEIADLYRRRW